jgi:iron complex outermembrane receptor protein
MPFSNVFDYDRPITEQSDPARFKASPTIRAAMMLAAAALLTGPLPGYAQEVSSDQQMAQRGPVEQIVVTGSRIGRADGFEAPTPVSVLSATDLQSFASDNIADAINTMPAFAGSATPGSSIQNASSGSAAMNVLNLRSLGTNRTLVLVDGMRVVASALDGSVDINNIPQELVERVEVVTGGASAVYGSDAVGGVVNFIMDTDYTGLKGSLNGGITDYGDRETVAASITGGTDFADGRGHIVGNASYRDAKGIAINRRPWNLKGWQFMYNPNYTPTNGQPERILLRDVATSDGIRGGIITNTALRGTAFGEGGTPYQFQYGDLVRDPDMHGGDWKKADVRGTREGQSLAPDSTNINFFTHASYQLTDSIEVFGEASVSKAETYNWAYSYECNSCFTIRAGNPFIPQSVASQMTALGITQFKLGTQNPDLGIVSTDADRTVSRFVAGFKGQFAALGSDWNWDVAYQRGISKQKVIGDHAQYTANLNRALDAVRHPVTGETVCRSTLTDPTNGCSPYNPMGIGVNSQATVDYIEGAGIRAFKDEKLTQDAAAASITGAPFSLWAGPLSIATGVAYRKDSIEGTNDPISKVRGWYIGGYGVANGSVDVTEAFLETDVPLARGLTGMEALDLNAAVRIADYSSSGSLTTWKAGLTYKPIEGVTFRGTRSRDARAPNLAELISVGGGGLASGTNPFTGTPLVLIPAPRTGNLNLQPELADGLGVGIVLQPTFLPGFNMSVDYWSVEISDAIATLELQEILNRCYNGGQQYCEAITFAPGTQNITEVRRAPFNYVEETAKGVDIELSYRVPVGPGDLMLRGLASHYLENTTNDGISPKRDTVGENDSSEPPKWRWNATVSYSTEPVQVSLTARGVSSGVYDNRFIQCNYTCPPSRRGAETTSNNKIDGQIVFDTSFNYSLGFGGSKMDLFLDVRNIMNSDPPVAARDPGADAFFYSPANYSLYDYLGRMYQAGVRVTF